jgi:hypothetical protein
LIYSRNGARELINVLCDNFSGMNRYRILHRSIVMDVSSWFFSGGSGARPARQAHMKAANVVSSVVQGSEAPLVSL